MTSAPSTTAFTDDELDAILRGAGGRDGAIGMSAIDGLIAALVAAPTFVHPDEWMPLIFGGRRPRMAEGSPAERAVRSSTVTTKSRQRLPSGRTPTDRYS